MHLHRIGKLYTLTLLTTHDMDCFLRTGRVYTNIGNGGSCDMMGINGAQLLLYALLMRTPTAQHIPSHVPCEYALILKLR